MNKVVVTQADCGVRIDRFLASMPGIVSRAQVKKMFLAQKIFLNGQAAATLGYRLKTGDAIHYSASNPEPFLLQAVAGELNILYEDQDLIVLNKPPGLLTHPSKTNFSPSLVHFLLHHQKQLAQTDDVYRPGIVHRLDKDTSGLLLVAKTSSALVSLQQSFQSRTIEKYYLAIVWGKVAPKTAKIDCPIGRHKTNRKKFAVVATGGKNAITRYQVLTQSDKASLLQVQIETGRTHQIRVHFHSLGHPILGDKLYGNNKIFLQPDGTLKKQQFPYQALHAHKMVFVHPTNGKKMLATACPDPSFFSVLHNFLSTTQTDFLPSLCADSVVCED